MIRHGETEANAQKIMAGSTDSPLTKNGIEQAKTAASIVRNLEKKPSMIIHSNLSRARDTAHIINEKLQVPIFEDKDFAEIHSGDYEGLPIEQCQEFLFHVEDPPGGESFEDFFKRIIRAKNNLWKTFPNAEMPLIVTHGGLFRAFVSIYGLNCKIVPNCILHEFTPEETSLNNNHKNSLFPWNVHIYKSEAREAADFFE